MLEKASHKRLDLTTLPPFSSSLKLWPPLERLYKFLEGGPSQILCFSWKLFDHVEGVTKQVQCWGSNIDFKAVKPLAERFLSVNGSFFLFHKAAITTHLSFGQLEISFSAKQAYSKLSPYQTTHLATPPNACLPSCLIGPLVSPYSFSQSLYKAEQTCWVTRPEVGANMKLTARR